MIQSWLDLDFWQRPEWKKIDNDLLTLRNNGVEYFPPHDRIFQALRITPFNKVKAVILGQDPYHTGAATGLAFSCNSSFAKVQPSLRNILTEYQKDLGYPAPVTGNLAWWAKQGVLMLNTTLTVLAHQPASHTNLGWRSLIEEILMEVSHTFPSCVFILWGAHAQSVAIPVIERSALKVCSAHPAAMSSDKGKNPFMGSRPFTKTNALLRINKQETIDWRLP